MQSSDSEFDSPFQWKTPLFTIIKVKLAFAIITFFLGYFIYHHPLHWVIPGSILLIAYAACVIAGIYYLIKTLPIPILMLLVPIAPLFVLIYVVSLISFLQRFT